MLNLPANYYTSLLGSEKSPDGTIIQLKLVPKDDRSFVKSVNLSVEEHGWLVRKIMNILISTKQKLPMQLKT